MLLANIVPPQWEEKYPRTGYRMSLAQWVLKHPEYVAALGRFPGHLMLDNGAFEGHPVTVAELHQASKMVGADEVSLPDVLGNAAETLKRSWAALSQLETAGVIFIPQGKTLKECQACLDAWMQKWTTSEHTNKTELIIGITCLQKCPDGHTRRKMVEYVKTTYDVTIHLLGIANPTAFVNALPYYEGVRGIDTSLAFALGTSRRLLMPQSTKVALRPPDQYASLGHWTHTLVYLNMLILQSWADTRTASEYIPLTLIRRAACWGGADSRKVMTSVQVALRESHVPSGGYAVTDEKWVRPSSQDGLRVDEKYVGVYRKGAKWTRT